ncbi:hypothetical protein ACJX0J_018943 [Zea mays]
MKIVKLVLRFSNVIKLVKAMQESNIGWANSIKKRIKEEEDIETWGICFFIKYRNLAAVLIEIFEIMLRGSEKHMIAIGVVNQNQRAIMLALYGEEGNSARSLTLYVKTENYTGEMRG